MRYLTKLIVASTVLFTLVATPITVLAQNLITEESQEENKINTMANQDEKAMNETPTQDAKIQESQEKQEEDPIIELNTGELVLKIKLDLETKKTDFKINLKNNAENLVIPEKSKQNNAIYYQMEAIPNGEYTLTIENEGYVPYQNQLSIKGDRTTIELTNQATINETIQSQNKYGLICIGDTNQDGKIDQTDEQNMIEKINKNQYDEKLDFNQDGKLNIVDLSYITYNKAKQEKGTEQKSVLIQNAKVELATTTKVQNGSVEDLLKSEANPVSLAPSNS